MLLFVCMNSLIGTREAAARLGVSVRRVQALIAAGRLPAKKIGNSFGIKESDLKLLNPRKNGRPVHEATQEERNQILAKYIKAAERKRRRPSAKPRVKNKTVHISKKLLEKSPTDRTPEEWNRILD